MYKFNYENQHFTLDSKETIIPEFPLTVTLQINRNCNLKCVYCSEYQYLDEISINNLKNLPDVSRNPK